MSLHSALFALGISTAAATPGDAAAATSFSGIDWAIVAIYLIASMAVGVYANRFIHKLSDYLVAGRGLGIYLAVATMTGTELGLVTVMYNAEEGFRSGFSAFTTGLIACATSLVIGLSGLVIMRLRAEGVMTIPEYYERRYGKKVRWAGGVVLSIACVLNFALFLKVGATYVTRVTGLEAASVGIAERSVSALKQQALPPDVIAAVEAVKGHEFGSQEKLQSAIESQLDGKRLEAQHRTAISAQLVVNRGVALKVVMSVMLILVLVYTALGGMVSVVITDFVQFVVLSLSLVIATWFAFAKVGGWDAMVQAVTENMGEGGFDPIQAGRYGWTFILWMAFLNLSAQICWLPTTLRALSAKSPLVAKRMYMWSGLSFLIRCVVPMLWGIAAFTLVKATPELNALFFPKQGIAMMQPIDAMPVLFARILPVGFIGVVTAGMLAAFMSTHDSYLLAFSAVITQDVIAPLCGRDLTDKERITITRVLIVVMGIFVLIFGLLYEPPESIWKYMAATGTIYLPGAFACLLAGIYWKRASSVGAALAIGLGLFGLAGMVDWPGMGIEFLNQDRIAMVTILLSITGMVGGSLAFPDREPTASAEPSPETPDAQAARPRDLLYKGSVVVILLAAAGALEAGIRYGMSAPFWKVVFAVGSVLFFAMAALIAVLGVKDLREMFALLRAQAGQSSPDQDAEPGKEPEAEPGSPE